MIWSQNGLNENICGRCDETKEEGYSVLFISWKKMMMVLKFEKQLGSVKVDTAEHSSP